MERGSVERRDTEGAKDATDVSYSREERGREREREKMTGRSIKGVRGKRIGTRAA